MEDLEEVMLLLHEDILEESEEDVKDLLRSLQEDKAPVGSILRREVRLENDPEWPMSAVHRAAAVGNTAILSLFLHASPEVDINIPVSRQGLTCLHLAAAEGHVPMVNYLASNGAQVNTVDNYGRTALHLAAEEGHRDVAQILGVKSAASMVKDHRGLTPLHLAAAKGHTKMVSYLAKKADAKLDITDDLGQTPLHKAMAAAAVDVSEVLIFHDVNINAQDNKGNTPLHLAILGFAHDTGRTTSPSMTNGAAETMSQEVCRKTVIDVILNAGCDVNTENKDGDTALHVAVSVDVLDVVKILLDRKAKVNALNRRGCSALFFCRNSLSVRLLADHRAMLMVRDNVKNTALHQFAGDNDIHSDIIDTMVELASDVNAKNVDERSPLFRACEAGHLEKVKKLLDYGADYNIFDRNKKSLLHACLESKADGVAYFLVDKVGITIQSSDENGIFPLHLAVNNGNLSLVDLLIKRGASVNVSDRKTTTPASLAIQHGHYDILRLLMQNGAKVEDKMSGSEAPLNLFAKCDDVINVCRLLDQSLDINRSDGKGRTALHDAIAARAYTVAKELLSRGASAKTADKMGDTPLHRAAYNCDDDDIFISLLDNGAQINQKNLNDETALHISVRNNRPAKVLTTLVNRGADILAFDKGGACPLHCVISESSGDLQCRENLVCLLSSNEPMDLNVLNAEGKTMLQMAAKRNYPSACRLLLEHGANVDIADKESRTALHQACMLDNCDVAKVLVKSKATLDVLDNQGASPLYYAVKSGVFETVELLLGNGADCGLVSTSCQYPLHEALSSGNSDLVELFLMNDIDVSYTDSKRRTALHLAALSAPSNIVSTIINMNADVGAVDSHGNTALHLAMRNSDVGVAQLLVGHGNINAQNKDGNTPLHLSCLHATYDHINLLLERGADFTLCNAAGETAMHLAAKSDDQDALELLISNDADLNIRDHRGNTPFLVALAHDNFDAAKTLAEQDGDVRSPDNEGQTALHKLAMKNNPPSPLVSLLFKRGLSAYAQDSQGQTPLQLASDETLQLLTKLRLEDG